MTAALIVALELAACTGYGGMALRALALDAKYGASERIAWSFAIGFGILGWLLFFLGWANFYQQNVFVVLLGVGLVGNILFRDLRFSWSWRPNCLDWVLVAAFGLVAVGDLMEALAPPPDADTLAYHFQLPKQFLNAGGLEFVRRALDGAVPLLTQMTYLPPLALGGERALMFWCMVTGWLASALLFVFIKRYVSVRIAAMAALCFMSTPLVLASAGTGQVEIRIALFVIVAGVAFIDFVRTGDWRYAFLAGIMAGFYAGSKYIGLLFIAALGLASFMRPDRIRAIIVIGIGALLAGFQWYLWNWIHTGDPFFPILIGAFGIGNGELWPLDFNVWFQEMAMAGELPLPRTLFWFFAYPFFEIFVGFPEFGGGRVGLGPFVVLVLPFAAHAGWKHRKKLWAHPLSSVVGLSVLFYILWFIMAPSQRIRHLFPIYPLLLAAVTVAAAHFSLWRSAIPPIAIAFAVAISIQLGVQAIYSAGYARHLISSESRHDFLERNVSEYAPVPWINEHLGPNDRLFIVARQLTYLIDVPVFLGHVYDDPRIDLRPYKLTPDELMKSLRRYNITHVLVNGSVRKTDVGASFSAANPWSSSIESSWDALSRRGCLDLLRWFEIRSIGSRTLDISNTAGAMGLFQVKADCN